ncbi:MAG: ABC-F type ribosomal protection protein [Clostridia bacterium]|nr:ABC-F type ribosomal protection protein [Clostridia bacterium]
MATIAVRDLSFCHEGTVEPLFSHINLTLDTDWKLGFIGRNGRGKTTFLKLLLGQYEYSGKVSANVYFEYFPFVVPDPTQTTLDILKTIAPSVLLWQVQKEVAKLAVMEEALYRPFETLSNGEQTKALLAGLFLRENGFLLIDEPTNHLDINARETVARYLHDKSGFILVSHDRGFLDACIDHVLSINKTNIEIQSGNFSSWWHNKQLQDAHEIAENQKLKKEIKRLESAARQSSQWANKVESAKMGKGAAALRKSGHAGMDTMAYYGEKSKRMQQRRKNLERRQRSAIEEKSGLLRDIETAEPVKLVPLSYYKERLLEVRELSVCYGEKTVFCDLTFELQRGDRVAVSGPNGCGKSSLLKLLIGEPVPYTGEVRVGSGLIVSYVSQSTNHLAGPLDDYLTGQGLDITLVKARLRKLDFARAQFEQPLERYREGQKKKLLLAASLSRQAHVYLWDEPLNYIDVLSRMQIEALLLEFEPTLLFVEHDGMFCERVATRVITLW